MYIMRKNDHNGLLSSEAFTQDAWHHRQEETTVDRAQQQPLNRGRSVGGLATRSWTAYNVTTDTPCALPR